MRTRLNRVTSSWSGQRGSRLVLLSEKRAHWRKKQREQCEYMVSLRSGDAGIPDLKARTARSASPGL